MKALILCAGYATRMYPLTKDRPKPLLPVAGRPMIEHILKRIEKVNEIDKIFIITNKKFFSQFEFWKHNYKLKKEIIIFSDGTTSDKNKLGAIGDIRFVIEKAKINDDILIVAGDNLFNFDLNKFVKFFRSKSCIVAVHYIKDRELIKKYNEVILDKQRRIISFVEKPQNPKTTLTAICMYLFSKENLKLVKEYLEEGNEPDPPGKFLEWLYKKICVYGYLFRGTWFDIGDIRQYEIVNKIWQTRK
ncbi:MAG: nucleotidyltransferase family protein [bacterium]|nr:nucleotidyltransferase family protein [bacterium]